MKLSEINENRKKIPQFPQKLSGSFWAITSFFNPERYKNKYENYCRFRELSKKQGLKLLAIELTFGNDPFELTKDDAEILIQIRTTRENVIWQKERLLNIGLKHLPEDCDKIAWLDCDIGFENNNWVRQTAKILETYQIVQPFTFCYRLPAGIFTLKDKNVPFGLKEGQKLYSRAYGMTNRGHYRHYEDAGHTGLAWAARREIFDRCGFFDVAIFGSGDSFMAKAFYGIEKESVLESISPAMYNYYLNWERKIDQAVGRSIYYTPGQIFHFWHGDKKNRRYEAKGLLYSDYDFDPEKDISFDENNCWRWASSKPELHQKLKTYFWHRNEEGAKFRSWFLSMDWKHIFVNPLKTAKRSIKLLKLKIDRAIGLGGIILKRISPQTYLLIKTRLARLEKS